MSCFGVRELLFGFYCPIRVGNDFVVRLGLSHCDRGF
jgi:hypothetical protein